MNIDKIKPTTYTIKFDVRTLRHTIIIATKWDDKGENPTKWAIRDGDNNMCKLNGEFYWEPRPSERDEEYFAQFRFNSVEEAYECWLKFHGSES